MVGVVVGEVAALAVVELVVGAAAQLAAKQHMVAVVEAPPAVEQLTSQKKMQQLAEEAAYYLQLLLLYPEPALGHVTEPLLQIPMEQLKKALSGWYASFVHKQVEGLPQVKHEQQLPHSLDWDWVVQMDPQLTVLQDAEDEAVIIAEGEEEDGLTFQKQLQQQHAPGSVLQMSSGVQPAAQHAPLHDHVQEQMAFKEKSILCLRKEFRCIHCCRDYFLVEDGIQMQKGALALIKTEDQ